MLTPARIDESAPPFYTGIPLLADMAIRDLAVNVASFTVRNNLADLDLNGQLELSGTVKDLRISGDVRVDTGSFKLPLVREPFTITQAVVSFESTSQFPKFTPQVRLRAQAEHRDANGQDHIATLALDGLWSKPRFSLSTDTGLNRGDTFQMLTLGRTLADTRAKFGDEAIGKDPGSSDRGTTTTGGTIEEFAKEGIGEFLSILLKNSLEDLTELDVVRLRIGPEGLGVYLEKRFTESIRGKLDWDRALLGTTIDVSGELRLRDDVSVEAKFFQRTFTDDSEEDINDVRARAVIRYPIIP